MGALPFCTSAPQVSKALQLMRLGGACGAAAAVAARAPAQKDDHIARRRLFRRTFFGRRPARRLSPCALPHSRVIYFVHHAGGKAYLVAVAGITGSRRLHQLALRQLAGHSFAHRLQRVCRTGDAHGPKHIAAVCKRVADGAANAWLRRQRVLFLWDGCVFRF